VFADWFISSGGEFDGEGSCCWPPATTTEGVSGGAGDDSSADGTIRRTTCVARGECVRFRARDESRPKGKARVRGQRRRANGRRGEERRGEARGGRARRRRQGEKPLEGTHRNHTRHCQPPVSSFHAPSPFEGASATRRVGCCCCCSPSL
jgi:hypothetical protein